MSNLYGNARIKDIDEYMDRRTQSKIDDQNDSLELPRKLKNKNTAIKKASKTKIQV